MDRSRRRAKQSNFNREIKQTCLSYKSDKGDIFQADNIIASNRGKWLVRVDKSLGLAGVTFRADSIPNSIPASQM